MAVYDRPVRLGIGVRVGELKLILAVVLGRALLPLAFVESRVIFGGSTRARLGPFGLAAGGVFLLAFGFAFLRAMSSVRGA